MPKPQPSFTAEFKKEAVQLAYTSGKPKAQIARELGISESALYSWCKQSTDHGSDAFPGKGHQTPLEVLSLSMVDNSAFSPTGLTARETRLILASQGVLPSPHFK